MTQILWSDEFDAPENAPADPRWWAADVGAGGWGNKEQQAYTASLDNAFHDGRSSLVICAKRSGDAVTSARLVTKDRFTFQYGRLECRARVARGEGLWSAVWALGANIDDVPWPGCGEIDILENVGSDPHRLFGTVHCPGHAGPDGLSGAIRTADPLSSDFRIYSVEWSPDRIAWQLDGTEYFAVTRDALGRSWVFDHPFYLLINLAVGGTLGGEVGDTALPADLLIDYVRLSKP